MDEWLRWALTVPLAGALGALWLVPPVPRWRRRVKHAHTMAEALPPGPERDYFEARAVAAARLIINYTTLIPRREKAYSWAAVVLLAWIIVVAAIDPVEAIRYFAGEGLVGWALGALGLTVLGPAVVGAITGRSARGMDPEHYQDYLRRQRELARKQRVQWIARRRVSRIRRRSRSSS